LKRVELMAEVLAAHGRDTQKTQNGIETSSYASFMGSVNLSRHPENPERD